jgi:hypothetical protein
VSGTPEKVTPRRSVPVILISVALSGADTVSDEHGTTGSRAGAGVARYDADSGLAVAALAIAPSVTRRIGFVSIVSAAISYSLARKRRELNQ